MTGGAREGAILVLGGGGLLGHKLFQVLGARYPGTWCTLRSSRTQAPWRDLALFDGEQVIDGLDVSDLNALEQVLRELRPRVVINAIGAIKQRAEAQDPVTAITLNALLPHRVSRTVREWDGRVIHFSTDCVFSGRKGGYTEHDDADATDLYGRSKLLGEIGHDNELTLRTSFIGRELVHRQSLLEWLLAQNPGTVKGFTRSWWSGVTSIHLAEIVADLVARDVPLSGLYQVSSGRISKHDLLVRLCDAFGLNITVEPDDAVACDRSLNGSRFAAATGYRFPGWEHLMEQLVNDPTPYHSGADARAASRK